MKNVRLTEAEKEWAIDQYKLMCNAMGVGMKSSDDGATPFEAVCVLLSKVEAASEFIKSGCPRKRRDSVSRYIDAHHDSEDHCLVQMRVYV